MCSSDLEANDLATEGGAVANATDGAAANVSGSGSGTGAAGSLVQARSAARDKMADMLAVEQPLDDDEPATKLMHVTAVGSVLSASPSELSEHAAAVDVLDIWSGAESKGLRGSYTAKAVPLHGTAFLLLE